VARSVMPHWKRHHSGVVPSEGFPAHQGLDVGGDRAEFADLAGHPRRGHGQLGARAEEAGEVGEVGEVVVAGAEVLEGVDAHDSVEALLLERQVVGFGPHRLHLSTDARLAEDRGRLIRTDPPVRRDDPDARRSGSRIWGTEGGGTGKGGGARQPHTTRVAPANGISSSGASRTGAEGLGAWIICPLPT